MEHIIEIRGLQKSFGEVAAVRSLSFNVRRGELFAFLGVNGAGKSTTISIMCGLETRDAGTVEVCGRDVDSDADDIKRRLGVVFQNSVLDDALSARDNLRCRAALYGIRGKEFAHRLDELCGLFGFEDYIDRPVGKLSGGQRRRIDVARALIHRPEILILDEPTTGLDPQTRRHLWDVVRSLRKSEGMTVFLTTHYMEEAAEADYVVILEQGRIAAEGTPHELKKSYTGDFITLYGADIEECRRLLGVNCEEIPGAVRVSVPDTSAATKMIIEHPQLFCDYEISKGGMDDVFLAVTGRSLVG